MDRPSAAPGLRRELFQRSCWRSPLVESQWFSSSGGLPNQGDITGGRAGGGGLIFGQWAEHLEITEVPRGSLRGLMHK